MAVYVFWKCWDSDNKQLAVVEAATPKEAKDWLMSVSGCRYVDFIGQVRGVRRAEPVAVPQWEVVLSECYYNADGRLYTSDSVAGIFDSEVLAKTYAAERNLIAHSNQYYSYRSRKTPE